MALTTLDIKDKQFGHKFRGYHPEEVDEFLEIIVRDYEDLVRTNKEQENTIKNLNDRLDYFDELKDSLSQSVIMAQETADKMKAVAEEEASAVRQQADRDAEKILEVAKVKANEMLRQAVDNAKRLAVETEDLKNKTRIFHQRMKATIESQLSIVDSHDWQDLLTPSATYLQTSDEALKEVLESVLERDDLPTQLETEEEPLDMTRQFSPEELAELQRRTEQGNAQLQAALNAGLADI